MYDYIDTYDNRVDIMVEAKAKELAVMRYQEIHYKPDVISESEIPIQ